MVRQYHSKTRRESEGIMSQIERVNSGALARNSKLNEVIDAINSIRSNLTVREGSANESPKLVVADRGCTLITTGGGSGTSGSSTLTLEYVSGNTVEEIDFVVDE